MNRLDLAESVARTVTGALGIGILEAAGLAALVFAFARLSRPSATTRHVFWWIALAAGASLPLVSIASSLGRIEHRVAPAAWTAPAAANSAASLAAAPATARQWLPAAGTVGQQPSIAAPPQSASETAVTAATRVWAALAAVPHLALALVILWLIVALAGLGLLARSLLGLAAIKRAALPLDESVVRRLRRWRHSTRLGRAVELRVSNEVDVPVAVGFRTPTILLPARVVETEALADLDQIAMHEYAHLDRYDDWTNLVQRVVERIFWFNPVLWLLGRQISLEREIACDDWVVAQTGRAHRYATCLWKLVESARLPVKPILAPGALLSPKQITTRIEQLLDSRRNALPRLSPLGAIALAAFGVALAILQAHGAPVIAVEDVAPAAAAPAVATISSAPLPREPVRPPATRLVRSLPAPAPLAKTQTVVLRVAADATPQAIATAMARVLSARDHTIVKATIERAIAQSVAHSVPKSVTAARAAAASDGARLGFDIATSVASTVATTVAPEIAKTVATTVANAVSDGDADDSWDDREPAHLDRLTLGRCFGCDFHGRDLRGLDLHGVALTGDNLRGADLRGVDLSGAKLVGVDLRDAKLDGANLSNAALNGCDLRATSLTNANLDGVHLTGTSIRGTTLGGSRLRSLVDRCMGCDLRGLDLRGQDLHGIELVGADLRDADLRGANLSHARLQGVDLRGAHLEGADLTKAQLNGCNLDGVDLDRANTHGMSHDVGLKESIQRLVLASQQLDDASQQLDDASQQLDE